MTKIKYNFNNVWRVVIIIIDLVFFGHVEALFNASNTLLNYLGVAAFVTLMWGTYKIFKLK